MRAFAFNYNQLQLKVAEICGFHLSSIQRNRIQKGWGASVWD